MQTSASDSENVSLRLPPGGDDWQRLVDLYRGRTAIVGVVGLGYVGLPLAMAAVNSGFVVIGLDVDPDKVASINAGESYIKSVASQTVGAAVQGGRLQATTRFEKATEIDALIVCVPTPLTAHREPDLSFVIETTRAITPYLRRGHLVVLESTTWPGTTREIMAPILEQRGLKSGEDFYLAYSPEREDPGNPLFTTEAIPKVIGGDGAHALALATELYGAIVPATVPVSSTNVAEAVKLTENIFRAVNIALVNELKVVYAAMGIDIWEVIEAAKTKPFGYMPFYPGPGLGGHCIPIDPFYLTWKARAHGISTRFIELAGEINTAMPSYVVDRIAQAYDQRTGRGLSAATVLLVGMAYKKNVADVRESPSFKLIKLLERRGAKVDFFDPHVDVIPMTREHPDLTGRRGIRWDPVEIGKFDIVVIATDHDDVDYPGLCEVARLIVDTRNACARAGIVSDTVVKA